MGSTDKLDLFDVCIERLRAHLMHRRGDEDSLRARIIAQGRWQKEQSRRLRLARRVLAVGTLLYVGLFGWLGSTFFSHLEMLEHAGELSASARMTIIVELGFGVSVPMLIAIAGVWSAHHSSIIGQLSARAIYWGLSLVVVWSQSVLLTTTNGLENETGTLPISSAITMVASLTCVGVLGALGDHGLRSPLRAGFEPTAFRGFLLLSLVMGMADAMLLGFVGLNSLIFSGTLVPAALWLALWLGVSAWGLLRLRVWGLVAMAAGNLLELVAAGTGGLESLGDLLFFLITTAVVQLLLPLPVYRAMLSKQVHVSDRRAVLHHAPSAVLIAVGGFAVAQFVGTLVRG